MDVEPAGIALAALAFSGLFIAAQFLHPDPFAVTGPANGVEFAARINNAFGLHLAHFLEFVCAPLLLVTALHLHFRLKPALPRLATLAVIMAGVGSFMLAGNKAALCLTASAFDTLDDAVLAGLAPALEALMQRRGFMAVLWGIPLLPLGFVLFGYGLLRARLLARWQAAAILVGSLMLANPEIQAVNTIASMVLAVGLVPLGVGLLREAMAGPGNAAADSAPRSIIWKDS